MKISYSWLKDFIAFNETPEEIAEILTDLGLEVEGLETFESIKGGLNGVVAGKVLSCKKHPNADKLKLVCVDIGEIDTLSIICGAPNIAKGQTVAVATVGTTLYDSKGEALKIKKSKIRGEVSFGMICSEKELGLSDNHEEILELDHYISAGRPFSEVFELEKDFVFEIGLTPNRTDAMSHLGVARDLKAYFETHNNPKPFLDFQGVQIPQKEASKGVEVIVENPFNAVRYCGVTITDISVCESPLWLKNKLKSIGICPKNNIVDITNYVLHHLGQPLHAFDRDQIEGNKVVVRTAKQGETLLALDEKEYKLSSEDLMICDAQKPMCIAGVLGGLKSGVSKATRAIFLESAYFDPVSVRKTSKRHGLNTDASFRFERGIDPNITLSALEYTTQLILELSGGKVISETIDVYPDKIDNHKVSINTKNILKLLGFDIQKDVILKILQSLDIKIIAQNKTILDLEVPAYRTDVTREADITEEILRVYGFNKTTIKTSMTISAEGPPKYEPSTLQNIISNQLASQGFFEIMTNSLTDAQKSCLILDGNMVSLTNPLSKDLEVLRPEVLTSGLDVISYNIKRQQPNLKFFEFAKSYHSKGSEYKEQMHLVLFTSGEKCPTNWHNPKAVADIFFLKDITFQILSRLGIKALQTEPLQTDFLNGLNLLFKGQKMGMLGEVPTKLLQKFDVEQTVFYADLLWDKVTENSLAHTTINVKPPSKFPFVERDFALLIDQSVTFDDIISIANETEKQYLKRIQLFDVYQGDKLPKGKKSYGVRFTLQDEKATLRDAQIDKTMQSIEAMLKKHLKAELR
ncbi:phenylalanine--tRNA ligase beta subunit [Elysia marginata]|uniref:Phenylalanine--tRNA ligase beta subunit n=1 Tax=Elysia marginata TaxID=1093978 RepID=A0AAV4FIU4_9GAST|nr:phenylalanine--tRNA ligase beta subunit [Elysia marginata]